MVFHWSLSDSKSPQVSRTLLSILAVLNNAVVSMVSTRPPTSETSRPFNNPLVTVPKAPITIGIIITFMFHIFFQFSSKVEVLIFLFTFFQFYPVISRNSKVDNYANSLYYYYCCCCCCCWCCCYYFILLYLFLFIYYYYYYIGRIFNKEDIYFTQNNYFSTLFPSLSVAKPTNREERKKW